MAFSSTHISFGTEVASGERIVSLFHQSFHILCSRKFQSFLRDYLPDRGKSLKDNSYLVTLVPPSCGNKTTSYNNDNNSFNTCDSDKNNRTSIKNDFASSFSDDYWAHSSGFGMHSHFGFILHNSSVCAIQSSNYRHYPKRLHQL